MLGGRPPCSFFGVRQENHIRIYEAVRAADVDAGKAAMTSHLEEFSENYSKLEGFE
ncbi:MAG: hypothetical protein Q4B42_00295 [Oscillospiraceae bacterium]|nr:hypothetical protein [Oscillospiraceae bacterium]